MQLDSTAIHEQLRRLGGTGRRELLANLLAFSRVLRTAVPNVTPGRIIDVCRSLAYIDVGNHQDFHDVLLANLVSSQDDVAAFEALYQAFWQPLQRDQEPGWLQTRPPNDDDIRLDLPLSAALQRQVSELLTRSLDENDKTGKPDRTDDSLAYSPAEVLAEKDFEDFTADEVRQMRRVLQKLTPKLATALSRRTAAGFRGPEIDLRRSFRHSLRYGGDVMRLARKRKKVRKLRITLLCDVSGSMDRYSRFLLQFIYGLENEVTGIDAWVFSTRLTEITPYLRGRSYEDCLEHIAGTVHDWSGGTTIGSCVHEFVQGAGKSRVGRRSVVIIISDGWDRGDVRLLERAMQRLKRRAHTVIWLNPLLGSPSYQPLCAGMRAALPYTDYFLPVHNIASLVKLTRTLQTLNQSI